MGEIPPPEGQDHCRGDSVRQVPHTGVWAATCSQEGHSAASARCGHARGPPPARYRFHRAHGSRAC